MTSLLVVAGASSSASDEPVEASAEAVRLRALEAFLLAGLKEAGSEEDEAAIIFESC